MATPLPSSGLASSSLLSSTQPSLDAKLDRLIAIAREIKKLESEKQQVLDLLDQLVEAGEAEESLSWNDCKITRRTRSSYSYPPHILEQREQLKASERLSLALGEASITIKHFWEIRGA